MLINSPSHRDNVLLHIPTSPGNLFNQEDDIVLAAPPNLVQDGLDGDALGQRLVGGGNGDHRRDALALLGQLGGEGVDLGDELLDGELQLLGAGAAVLEWPYMALVRVVMLVTWRQSSSASLSRSGLGFAILSCGKDRLAPLSRYSGWCCPASTVPVAATRRNQQ